MLFFKRERSKRSGFWIGEIRHVVDALRCEIHKYGRNGGDDIKNLCCSLVVIEAPHHILILELRCWKCRNLDYALEHWCIDEGGVTNVTQKSTWAMVFREPNRLVDRRCSCWASTWHVNGIRQTTPPSPCHPLGHIYSSYCGILLW